jgi:DNA polymerase-3 subunit epsilon
MRQVLLDTETTGLDPASGHRVIEIGCVELLDRKLTGNRFHVYLNPEREVDAGAVEIHGLSTAFLADKPKFAAVAMDFVSFVEGAELVIHNAPFDVGFLNHELNLLGSGYSRITDYCAVLDTLTLARKKHPGQRNSLDALCKRYNIDNTRRNLHGALLDAEILAEVYLAMTGGQTQLILESDVPTWPDVKAVERTTLSLGPASERPSLRVIVCNDAEELAHAQRLDAINISSSGQCLWNAD